jgi:hypothetical protein
LTTWIRPERSEAAIRKPSQRNEGHETTSEKEEMVEEGERVLGLKRVREVKWVAAKGCGGVGEKVREVMEEMRFGIWWVLKEDQYLDSGVCLGVLGFGLSFGLMGLKVRFSIGTSIITLQQKMHKE